MFLKQQSPIQTYVDDVASEDEIIADDTDLKNSPTESKKLENIREE